MNILSIGDSILTGQYICHSRFNKVVNYTCDGNLLSVVSSEIGNGPVNIVVNDIIAFDNTQIIYSENKLITDNTFYSLNDVTKFNSYLTVPEKFYEKTFYQNLEFLKTFLLEHASEKSLAFILNNKRKENFKSTFEINYLKKIFKAINNINKGCILDGVKTISGCGFGYTPSGDDFISGMLAALNTYQLIHKKEKFNDLIKEIINNAKTENIISWNTIRFAGDGKFNEKFKKLVLGLFCDNKKCLFQIFISTLHTGATSGADMLSGFLFTFANIDKFEIEKS